MPLTDQQAQQVINNYLHAWRDRDAEALVACFTPGGTYSDPLAGKGLTGEAIRKYAGVVWDAFPDAFQLTPTGNVRVINPQRGLVVHRWRMSGTNNGPLPDGSPPTWRILDFQGTASIVIDCQADPRIRSIEVFYDLHVVHEQLGRAITGGTNVKEALGFLKDWTTALMAIETAAIAAFVAFLPQIRNYHHWNRWLLGLTLLCLFLSLWCGWNVLYMLPGCAQRKPDPTKDIYSLRTRRRELGVWVKWFWFDFMVGAACILIFYASTMGVDFHRVSLVITIVILATFQDWRKAIEDRSLLESILVVVCILTFYSIRGTYFLRGPFVRGPLLIALAVLPIFIDRESWLKALKDWSWPEKVKSAFLPVVILMLSFAIVATFVLPWEAWNKYIVPPSSKKTNPKQIESSHRLQRNNRGFEIGSRDELSPRYLWAVALNRIEGYEPICTPGRAVQGLHTSAPLPRGGKRGDGI